MSEPADEALAALAECGIAYEDGQWTVPVTDMGDYADSALEALRTTFDSVRQEN